MTRNVSVQILAKILILKMNFSELFKHTGQLCHYSPDGNYLVNVVQYRVIIRDVKTLQICHLFTCLDAVQNVQWSPDSQFLLCGMYKRGLVQVWSMEQPEWTCKIDEGSAGLAEVCWSPDSRHILTTAEFHVRITVWSLLRKSVSYIKHPKACHKGLDFTSDGKYLALAERRDCKDYVSIFTSNTWQLVRHFETDTDDLDGVQWSPDSRAVAVWESCLQYKVVLYSLDGRCLATYTAYEQALGVKSISWSPTSQFLAIGSFDQKFRLLNHITWKTVVDCAHPTNVDSRKTVIYKEFVKKPQLLQGEYELPAGMACVSHSKYEVVEGSHQVASVQPDLNKANPQLGVGYLAFSPDAKYLVTKNDNMPNYVWIWDVRKLNLAVLLIQDAPVKCIEWDPSQARLALCTATNRVYMWSPAGCLSVEVPSEASFLVHSIKWHSSGNALLLIGKDKMCMCYLATDNQ